MTFDGGVCRVAAAEIAPFAYVVRASGLFDVRTATRLRRALDAVDAAHGERVLIDLRGATAIDGDSVGVIASAARLSHARGDDFAVITQDPTLQARLDASGAEGLVRFESSVRQWLAQ